MEAYEVGLLLALSNDLRSIVAGVKADLSLYAVGIANGALPISKLAAAAGVISAENGGSGRLTPVTVVSLDEGRPTAQSPSLLEQEASERLGAIEVARTSNGPMEAAQRLSGDLTPRALREPGTEVRRDDDQRAARLPITHNPSVLLATTSPSELPVVPRIAPRLPKVTLVSERQPHKQLTEPAISARNERAAARVADVAELASFSASKKDAEAVGAQGTAGPTEAPLQMNEFVAGLNLVGRVPDAPKEVTRARGKAVPDNVAESAKGSQIDLPETKDPALRNEPSNRLRRGEAMQTENADGQVGAAAGDVRGDVYLDGALVGRWISRLLNRESERASSGPTGFDRRRGRLMPGSTVA